MSAGENKQLMRRIFAELAQGSSRLLVESMSDDFCWTVAGSNSWSRTFAGKTAVLKELLAPLSARIAGKVKIIADCFVAEGDHVIVEARGDNMTRSGVPYCNRYCFVFRFSDAMLCAVTEYADTELVTTALGKLE
jgi:ketosteroid isomerase-like protein